MMKLLKENIRQSTLTQWSSDGQEWPLWARELSIKRQSRGGGSQEDGTAWAQTLREEIDRVVEELKDHGGGRSEQGECGQKREGRERLCEILQAVVTSWDLIPNTGRGYWSTASEEQSVLFLMFWGPSILFPVTAAPFCNPTNSVKSSSFSTSSPTLVCCCS